MDHVADGVKSTRGYDSTQRHHRTRFLRRAVLQAALTLMSEDGYVATTISAVASRAGTSAAFAYKQFGDKPGLAGVVLDFALAGDDVPLPMTERPHIRQMIAEPDAAVMLALYAQTVTKVNTRAGAFLIGLAAAAPTDTRLAQLWRTAQAKRLSGTRAMVRNVATKAPLKAPERAATDVVWALIGPEMHRLLTRDRRWSTDQYTTWIAHSLVHALLEGSNIS